MGRKQKTVLSFLALLLLHSIQATPQATVTKGQGESPSPEFTVPLGKTAGDFTFSKSGILSYKGRAFNPAVKVRDDWIQAFRISLSRDKHWAGAIAEDIDGQNSAYLLELGTLVAIPLQKAGAWSAAYQVFWSPSGGYMLVLCAYEGQRFIGVDLSTKKVVEGDFLGSGDKRWVITDEPRWYKGSDALTFTINETCDPYNEANCDSEFVLATHSAFLNPATLRITTKKIR